MTFNPQLKAKKIISLPKLKEKAQKVFNVFIRERDKNNSCISCNARVEQAGHFYSAGHYNAIRFEEDNAHGQCVRCNYFLSGNLIEYRKRLQIKIGDERMLKLEWKASEAKKHPKKWTRFELELIIDTYKQKIKEL